MALVPTKQTFASSAAVSEGLTSEKDVCFHPQEMSSRPQPAISVKETQPTPKRERNSLLAPENPQRLRSSPSSLEINPPSFIPSQPTLFYLLEEIVAIKGTLRMLSESSTQIQVELSKMSGNITKIHTWMEKSEPSTEQVGDHQRRLRPVKQEPLPPPAHKPVCSVDKCSCSFCPKPKLEKKLIYQTANTASLVGDPMGQLRVVSQKELTPLKGKRKYATLQTLEPIREDMRLEMAQNKMENQQSSKDISSLASVTDVVLTTVASLKNSTKATMNTTVAKLQAILEEHKADVADQVSEIVEGIYFQVSSIPLGSARRAVLNVVTLLAEEHTGQVVASLLNYSLPCNSSISEIWKSLCTIPETNTKIMWHLLKELKQRPRFQENGSEEGTCLIPLAAMRALGEMLKIFTCIGAMRGFYPQVFLALLTQIHFLVSLSRSNEDPGKESSHRKMIVGRRETAPRCIIPIAEHVRFAMEVLKTLLIRDRNEMALLWMEKTRGWDLLSRAESYLEGILLLARDLVTHTRHHVTGLLAEVIPKLRTEDEERVLTARALFAGFLCSKSTLQLLPSKSILSKLEEWLADPRPTIRWLSLHGFGNMALHRHKVKQLDTLLFMILVGLKEPHDRAVNEALKALANILQHHRRRIYVGARCARIAEKLQPLLVDERDQVRSSAIGLFGKLLLGLRLRHKSMMQDQVLSNVVHLLLHLHDHSEEVVENCEWTLARCNDFLGWKLLEEIIVLAHYDSQQALSKICKHLVRWYPGRVHDFLSLTMGYLRSPEAPLRRAASVFTGFLIFHMDARHITQEDTASLLSGLGSLVHDSEPSVSRAASVSILQVKHVGSSAASLRLRTLRAFGCLPRRKGETPLFEDSPFKRKRHLEASGETPM